MDLDFRRHPWMLLVVGAVLFGFACLRVAHGYLGGNEVVFGVGGGYGACAGVWLIYCRFFSPPKRRLGVLHTELASLESERHALDRKIAQAKEKIARLAEK